MDASRPTGCGSSFRNCLVWGIAPWLSDMPSGIWIRLGVLADPILGDRLRHDVRLMIRHKSKSALEILESPDELKFRSGFTKQGEAGPKLEFIGRFQDFQRRLALVAYHEAHVVAQAVPENWISQITPSLIHIPDGISLSHGAMPQ